MMPVKKETAGPVKKRKRQGLKMTKALWLEAEIIHEGNKRGRKKQPQKERTQVKELVLMQRLRVSSPKTRWTYAKRIHGERGK